MGLARRRAGRAGPDCAQNAVGQAWISALGLPGRPASARDRYDAMIRCPELLRAQAAVASLRAIPDWAAHCAPELRCAQQALANAERAAASDSSPESVAYYASLCERHAR